MNANLKSIISVAKSIINVGKGNGFQEIGLRKCRAVLPNRLTK